jgi:hypothetical protein
MHTFLDDTSRWVENTVILLKFSRIDSSVGKSSELAITNDFECISGESLIFDGVSDYLRVEGAEDWRPFSGAGKIIDNSIK